MASVNIWYELWVEVKPGTVQRIWWGSSKERAVQHGRVHGGEVVEVVEVRDAAEAVSAS